MVLYEPEVLLVCFICLCPQMSEHWSALLMIRANLSCSFGLYFVYTSSCCLPEMNASETSSNFIQHAYTVLYIHIYLFNNLIQHLTSVANSISPIVRAQDSQFSCIHCMYLATFFLNLGQKKIGQVPTRLWQVIKMQTFPVKICMAAHAYFSVY